MSELVKVDPKEFGLEESKANELTIGLTSILEERKVLIDNYSEIVKLELSEDNIPEFKELRLKIRDNRTKGIEKWHKVNKQYFLTGGRFVDAIKNREVAENERMEAKLMEGEKHFENLEKEKVLKLENDRIELCKPYVEDESLILPDLGSMPVALWDNYIVGLRASYEAKKAEDKRLEDERINNERLDKIETDRYNTAIQYKRFWEQESYDFRDMCQDEFDAKIISYKKAEKEDDKIQEEIRSENERLHKEKKAKEAQQEIRNKELKSYITFIRDYNALLNSDEKEYQKQFSDIKKGAEDHWEYERKEQIKKANQEAKDEKDRKALVAKLQAKEDAEIQATKDTEAQKQSELNKGDADKVKDLISDLEALKTKYSFKSASNTKMYNRVGLLIDKVVDDIKK